MNQWRPVIFDGTKPIEPYVGKPDYNLDYDLADQTIDYVHMQHSLAPNKPFFIYYAPGATHAPHDPRKEWVEKYAGKFDQGWDVRVFSGSKRWLAKSNWGSCCRMQN